VVEEALEHEQAKWEDVAADDWSNEVVIQACLRATMPGSFKST
jgi:hypothetical protein